MRRIAFGCQTYTWQMSYEKYSGQMDHMLDVIAASGYEGVEAEVCMLGDYRHAPERLQEALRRRGLKLAALTLALPWREEAESAQEREEADRLIAYLRHFPDALMVFVQLPWPDRERLRERQNRLLSILHAVAARALDDGIRCAFHPNSPEGSLFRTADDYAYLFARLDPEVLGYAPDSGHIASGGMDPVRLFAERRQLIRHVHFKDRSRSGGWKPMGEGEIDHLAIVRLLRDTGYAGWIMVEEESEQAERDPDGVTLMNGRYVASRLRPFAGEEAGAGGGR